MAGVGVITAPDAAPVDSITSGQLRRVKEDGMSDRRGRVRVEPGRKRVRIVLLRDHRAAGQHTLVRAR
jgi:hypothetical protein